MGRVSATIVVHGPVADAEALWFDLDRWPAFMDGFAAVSSRDPAWPEEGSKLLWRSTPHGRGNVHERVTARGAHDYEVEFHDDKLTGRQRVEFAEHAEHTQVTLAMEYRIEEPNALTPMVDLLFVRRAIRDALRRTVVRFAREREGDIALS